MAMGIAAYQCYFPAFRLPAAALKRAWGSGPAGLKSKPVAGLDEDALTLATAAAAKLAEGDGSAAGGAAGVGGGGDGLAGVGVVSLASMSLPYRRKAQAGLLAGALGLGNGLLTLEHTTSARAGTEALLAQAALLAGAGAAGAGASAGLLVAAEVAWGPARGGADGAMGAGAVAFRLATGGPVATIDGYHGYAAEDPGLQFTRAEESSLRDVQVPDYAEAAYAAAIGGAARPLLERLGRRISDYRFVVLNPPDPRLARAATRALGATAEQWQGAWPYPQTGDLGAAHPLVGLAAALDAARPGDGILLVGYGSGSAADAISLTAGPACGQGVLPAALEGGREVDYVTYLQLRGEV